MLHKAECTVAEAPRALFVGFVIPNKWVLRFNHQREFIHVCMRLFLVVLMVCRFVVGYGLDYEQRLRAMPFIGVWNPQAAAAAAAAAASNP